MQGSGVFRLRVAGDPLGAGTARDLEMALASGAEADGFLTVRGLDGVDLHLPAASVREIRAEPCRAVVIRHRAAGPETGNGPGPAGRGPDPVR